LDTLYLTVLLPPAYFFVAASITPGPNNIMLAASGMNFGYRRTVPHLLGIASGFGLLVGLCAVGVGALYDAYPLTRIFLRVLGAGYFVYLAYRIATAGGIEMTGDGKPLTWTEALTFQFVNPKGWVVSLTSVASFMPDLGSAVAGAVFMSTVAIAVNLPCTSSWVLFGKVLGRLFSSPKSRKVINFTLAELLLATIPFVIS